MSPPQPHDRPPVLATPRQVQYAAAYTAAVGTLLLVLGLRGWALKGLLPAHWLGWPLLILAAVMFAKPHALPFRERVGRLVALFSS